MVDDVSLLQAILEAPDCDQHRLVYADWLEENGGEEGAARAELIRIQIDLATLPPQDPRRPELLRREAELLAQARSSWAREAFTFPQLTFQRGLVVEQRATPEQFRQFGASLATLRPFPKIHFQHVYPDNIDALVHSPLLSHLQAVAFRDRFSIHGAQLARFLASPHLSRLTILDLHGNDYLGNAAPRALAQARHLDRLAWLDLTNNGIGDEGLTDLARTPHLASLRTLVLSSQAVPISDTGVRALARSRYLKGLVELNLSGNTIGPKGSRILARSANLSRLERLDLSGNELGPLGILELLLSDRLLHLRWLDVHANGAERIDASTWSTLDQRVRRAALEPRAGRPRLDTLNLKDTHLDDRGVILLSRLPRLSELRSLDLGHNALTEEALLALVQSPYLGQLRHLDLSGARLGPRAARQLALATTLPHLERLVLRETPVEDDWQQRLRARFGARVLF